MRKNVVVIGGGLAGSLICNELVKNFDVTLLEIGSKVQISYPRLRFDRKALAEVNTFCFGGGGTTNLWHNGLIPIAGNDVIGEEFAGILEESKYFLDEAASRLFFKGKSFTRDYAEAVSDMAELAKKVGDFPDGIDCLLYPKKHSRLTVSSRVRDFYLVNNVEYLFESGRIKSVKFSAGSERHCVDSSVVIVCAGAMGTPRILGNIIESSGNRFGSLGSGLIDHPLGFVGKVKIRKEKSGLMEQFSIFERREFLVRSAFRIKSACGEYTCCAFLRPALTMDNRLSVHRFKSLLGASAGWKRIWNAISWRIFHLDIIAEIFSRLFGVNIPSRTYSILFIGEQRRGNNRVRHDGDEIRVDWTVTEQELAIYRAALEKLTNTLLPVAEQINIEKNITADWLWSGAHHSGTTPLGNSTADLIDRDLRLRYCENVFVCDGSVIQEHSYANTGLTIGQLALRLSKKLTDTFAT